MNTLQNSAPPLPIVAAWLTAMSALAILAGPVMAADVPAVQPQLEKELVTYTICDGRIEIKPRLKYELFLSLHVLRTAEDHHQLFIPWAQRMRASLAPEALQQATNLNALVHEWHLCSLVQDFDGADTIEGLTQYLRQARPAIAPWAGRYPEICRRTFGVGPEQLGDALASFLSRYYAEGFGKEWPEQQRMIEQQAALDVRTFEQLPFSIPAFMEKHTGRKFQGSTKLIFYPSSFSRPQHGYGFTEKGDKVVVYKVGTSPMGTALHELLHPLLRGWQEPERLQKAITELGQQPLFKTDVSGLRAGYDYPQGCLEELIVHAVANYLLVKAGLETEANARRHSYGAYENALYDAIFDRYDSFPVIDDFIYYALTHIRTAEQKGRTRFAYMKTDEFEKKP